ncbi:MAG: hypothetical protein MZV65_39810 [Chromatiales bacterium]|nr:hypothetical protein [Chromatiales bacterium]
MTMAARMDRRRSSAVRVAAGECACCARRGVGAAAAMNQGIREAAHPIICLDRPGRACLKPGWLRGDSRAAPQVGTADCRRRAGLLRDRSRVRQLWREWRAWTSSSATRRSAQGRRATCAPATQRIAPSALREAGLFDESFGYGYDNDMSYRLMKAGYALRFCPGAKSVHRWRETLRGYLVQQYGQGYGRLDIVWKHPGWAAGDAVSPAADDGARAADADGARRRHRRARARRGRRAVASGRRGPAA